MSENARAREEADMAHCTFRPVVHDAPAYVKQIASRSDAPLSS